MKEGKEHLLQTQSLDLGKACFTCPDQKEGKTKRKARLPVCKRTFQGPFIQTEGRKGCIGLLPKPNQEEKAALDSFHSPIIIWCFKSTRILNIEAKNGTV